MKNIPLIGLTLAFMVLTGCAETSTLVYSVTTNIAESGKSLQIFQASERVMIRRLAGADVKNPLVIVVPSGSGSAVMTIHTQDAAGKETAERILAESFTFDIRLEGPKMPEALPDEINWVPTGIDGSTLLWITPISNPTTKEVGVELHFNDIGQKLLQEAFKDNVGKSLGIFVRDLLVSKMTISTTQVSDHILISGIPSERVAQIFADDVNVGLHAIFTPLK